MFNPVSFIGKLFKKYLLLSAHPSKIRIESMLGRSLFPNGIRVKNEEGMAFQLDANDWITRTVIEEGNYEPFSTALAKNILKDGGLFIDIGANFGLFTCITAYRNDKVKVLAVEPNHKAIQRLLDNVALNGLKGQVQVINAAVSEDIQLVSIEQPVPNNLGTTLTVKNAKGFLSVFGCSLEFLLQEYACFNIELLKIDIEGNEFKVLENFPFENYNIKNIIMEFNCLSDVSFIKILSFFESKKFKSFSVDGEALKSDRNGIPENNIWFVNELLS